MANLIFQGFFNLAFPIVLMFFLGMLLVSKCSAPEWIYAPLLILGVFIGLFSMVKFLIYTLKSFEQMEQAQKDKKEL